MRYSKNEYFSPRSRCLCHCFWKELKVQMICVRQDVTRPGVDRSEKAVQKSTFLHPFMLYGGILREPFVID